MFHCGCAGCCFLGPSGLCTLRASGSFASALLFSLFLFLLGFFFDSRKGSKRLSTILGRARFSAELQFEKLLEDLVEFRTSRDSQCVEFSHGEREAQRAPLLDIIANFR